MAYTLSNTWKTRHFRHFTSQHSKVSKSEVVEKVITVADFWMSAGDVPKIILKNWWICVIATASQNWDVLRHTVVFPYTVVFPNVMGASNAGKVVRNRDSEPISGFIASCQRCDLLGVINTAPPNRGNLWHLPLLVSGGVCWWRETTMKCLW